MTFDDLIKKVQDWAVDKGLEQADPRVQWMRVTEEVGEIRDVLLKPTKFEQPDRAMADAIGDSFVTLIVLVLQLDQDPARCLEMAYKEIKNRKGKMINGTFVKDEDLGGC